MSIVDVVRSARRPLLTYTLVPPSQEATSAELDAAADVLRRLLNTAPLDAIHLPDVRPDPRSPRTRFVPKLAPRAFARTMTQRLAEPPEWLLDRRVVDHHWDHQALWLRRTLRERGFSSLMLVGGASSEVRYPGPSVVEAARRVRAAFGDDVCLGGISIPTRSEELERLMAKTEAGIDVFITQILGETGSTRGLLVDYHWACRDRGLRPRPIVASVAPVASEADVRFLESWGVAFDPERRRDILSRSTGVGERSINAAMELVDELTTFVRRETLEVTLGVNVEHVRTSNVELSARLLEGVASRLS